MTVFNTLDPSLLTRATQILEGLDGSHATVAWPIADNEPDRLRSPQPVKNLTEFYELVNAAVADKLTRDGDAKRLLFREDFSDDPDDIDREIVTFGLQKRLPGIAEQTPNPVKRNALRMRKPILREIRTDPANPKYRVFVHGQWFDNFVQFTCWARENKIANRRALWFEDLMFEYEWFFRAAGVSMLRYEGRGADTFKDTHQRKIVGRPMTWLVRTERIVVTHEKTLEEIAIKTHVMQRFGRES